MVSYLNKILYIHDCQVSVMRREGWLVVQNYKVACVFKCCNPGVLQGLLLLPHLIYYFTDMAINQHQISPSREDSIMKNILHVQYASALPYLELSSPVHPNHLMNHLMIYLINFLMDYLVVGSAIQRLGHLHQQHKAKLPQTCCQTILQSLIGVWHIITFDSHCPGRINWEST